MKTMSDDKADWVELNPVHFTVEDMVSLKPPAWSENLARTEQELKTYTLDADVIGYKFESDGDFHVVLRGVTDETIVAEFVDPKCAEDSIASELIPKARSQFLILFAAPTLKYKKLKKPYHVKITGVVFFDKLHGQVGAAPNGVELHPVLSIGAK